jgi:hypothetical protein
MMWLVVGDMVGISDGMVLWMSCAILSSLTSKPLNKQDESSRSL